MTVTMKVTTVTAVVMVSVEVTTVDGNTVAAAMTTASVVLVVAVSGRG